MKEDFGEELLDFNSRTLGNLRHLIIAIKYTEIMRHQHKFDKNCQKLFAGFQRTCAALLSGESGESDRHPDSPRPAARNQSIQDSWILLDPWHLSEKSIGRYRSTRPINCSGGGFSLIRILASFESRLKTGLGR